MVIPRYLPAISLAARAASLSAHRSPDAERRFAAALGLSHANAVLPVQSARAGLAAFFARLAEQDTRRLVLVSAQICPLVPRLLPRLGFQPFFVDTAPSVPVPGASELLRAYNSAGSDRVAAVIIAPMYGHVASDLDSVCTMLDETAVVLDLAQGLLLHDSLPGLMRRADAIVYSFGVGKGLDIGGGLLALRQPVNAVLRVTGRLAAFATLPNILAFQAAVWLGLYRYIIPLVDRASERDQLSGLDVDGRSMSVLPPEIIASWAARLVTFRVEVALARRRATELFALPGVVRHCQYTDVYGGISATHLRQILRLRDAGRRDQVLAELRAGGIDALPAGEALPDQYLPSNAFGAASDGAWPEGRRFRADAIRLPFLGRLDQASFCYLQSSLEAALEQRVP